MRRRISNRTNTITYQTLEARNLLAADFSFAGGVLELSNFVDSDAGTPNQIQIEQTSPTNLAITLSEGVFTNGIDIPLLNGLGTDTLLIDTLPVGDLAGAVDSIVLRSTNSDVFDIQFGDLDFGGDITIEQDGGAAFGTISQLAGTSLASTGALEITGANNINLDNSNNQLGVISIENANTIAIAETTDVDAALIEASGNVTVNSGGNVTIDEAEIDGVLEIATISGDIVIASTDDLNAAFVTAGGDALAMVDGNLTLEGPINLGEGNLLLDINGDVSQLSAGTINAAGLGLLVDGETVLNAANDVDILATDSNGAIQINDSNDLNVGTVTVSEISIDGVSTSDDDVKITSEGNVTFEEPVNVGEGDLFLDVDGDVSQLAAGTIDAAGLGLMVDGKTILNEANDVDVLAADINSATQVNDIDDLTVGTVVAEAVSADRAMAAMTGTVDAGSSAVTGVASSGDDFKLTVEGNLTLEEGTDLNTGDLFLDVNGDLSQLAVGTINAAGLGLMVEGTTVLNEANDIDVLAANNNGATQVNDINDLRVGTIIAEAVSADRTMNGTVDAAASSIIGVTTSDDDFKLTVQRNLTLEEQTDLGTGDLFLVLNGDVSQMAVGSIEVAGLGLMVEGETILNAANEIGVFSADNDGNTLVNSISGLSVGTVTAEAVSADRAMVAINGTVNAAAMSIDGVITSNDDATFNAVGDVLLSSPVSLGTGDLLVNSGADIFVGDVQAQNVSLNAQDDVRDTGFRDGQFVTTENLTIVALDVNDDGGSDGVRIDTATQELSVKTENEGGVFINELDDINLTSITSTGRVVVDAGGSINSEFVNVISSNDNNDVRLISPEQIVVTQLLTPGSDVFLIADNDVISTESALPILAENLIVRASNTSVDAQNGIVLSTDVASLDLVSGIVGSSNTGDITITEASSVIARTAVNRNGEISISTNNGNLVAEFAFSTGATGDDAIRLTANGIGADVATGRIVTFQRLGGIVVSASDDIRPITARPGVDNLLQSGSLELTAGNNQQDLFNGILAPQTRVRSLSANVTSSEEAGIFVANQGFLNVEELTVQSGSIALTNVIGRVRVENASIQNATPNGLISLVTRGEGSDLRVGNIFARGSEGVFLESEDDIFDTSFLDEIFIDADFLSATASNNVEDGDNDGIFLSTNAKSVFTLASNGGSVFIADRS